MSTLTPRRIALLLAATACSAGPPEPPFTVRFHVTTERGEPVSGARITGANRTLGETDETGTLSTAIAGKPGDTTPVSLTCPDGHVAIEPAPTLRFVRTRLAADQSTEQPLAWSGICRPTERQLVAIVHTAGIGDLPVLIDGTAHATTDNHGNAHVLLRVPSETQSLHVSIDTSSDPHLKPQNPTRAFALEDTDGLLVFEAPFTRTRPQKPMKQRSVDRRAPYRVK